MPDYSSLINKHVRVEISNEGGNNGIFGASLVSQDAGGITVNCSVGGQMQDRYVANERIVSVEQMPPAE